VKLFAFAAAAPLLLGAGHAAMVLAAGPTAANPPHAAAAGDSWNRSTDRQRRTPYRYINPAAYANSGNN